MRRNTLVLSILCAAAGMVLFPSSGCAFVAGERFESGYYKYIYGKYDDQKNSSGISGHHLEVTGGGHWRLYAAFSVYGDANNNTINVNNLAFKKENSTGLVAAGFTDGNGDANGNSIVVSNSTVMEVYGGRSNSGSATGNSVEIKSEVKPYLSTGCIYGAIVQNGSGVANNNRVTVSGQGINLAAIVGGENRSQSDANQNSVEIYNGNLKLVAGGSSNGSANENKVLINTDLNTDEITDIYGGTAVLSASANVVTINSGKVIGRVIGGSASVTDNNQILINGESKLMDLSQAILIGGTAQQSSGNALILKASDLSVRNIEGFQNLKFYVASTTDVGSTLLTLSDSTRRNANTTELADVDVDVFIAPRLERLNLGDEFVLLNNSDGIRIDQLSGTVTYDNSASILDYDWALDLDIDALVAKLVHIESKPETQSFLSANLSRLAFVNQGSDLLTGQGMVASREASQTGRHLFVALQTGSNHYNDNSYIDLEGESLLIGGSWSVDAFGSQMTVGGFVESGWGDYEAENALTPFDIVKGQGETHYQGAGLLAYWDQYPSADKGFYAEASVRFGRADLSYQMIDPAMNYDYDVSGAYHAAHVGLGFRYPINDENNIDLYTKFYYSHQDSDGFVIDQNSVKMNSITSKRWRAGLTYRHRGFTPERCVFDWQTSLAYEYEFDGKAQGSIDGFNIIDSELQGSTGIGEVSITFLPSADSDMRLRASIQGFAGTREGFIGQIQWTQMF